MEIGNSLWPLYQLLFPENCNINNSTANEIEMYELLAHTIHFDVTLYIKATENLARWRLHRRENE